MLRNVGGFQLSHANRSCAQFQPISVAAGAESSSNHAEEKIDGCSKKDAAHRD